MQGSASGLASRSGPGKAVLTMLFLPVRKHSLGIEQHKMLSILRKARLKDKEMRILMLCVLGECLQLQRLTYRARGLDNAGKTTIVKKIMNEDVNSVSPTLGFIIKTIDYDGYKLNICT